ncbi:MAG: glycerate kinase [Chloroflexota bacterium]
MESSKYLDKLITFSLNSSPFGNQIIHILAAAIESVDPANAVTKAIKKHGDYLIAGSSSYSLNSFKNIYIVGMGKAGAPMAHATANILENRVKKGVVVVKEGYTLPDWHYNNICVYEASHPLPDERGLQSTREIINLVQQAKETDLIICLISGGASALFTQPSPGITLEDLRSLTQHLLASGATINEINILRKHLDQVKGGQLAHLAYPATVITLILSDVIGNPFDIIASGPTVPDLSSFSDAIQIIEKYDLLEKITPSIRTHLERGVSGKIPETPKPDDPIFQRCASILIGSNEQAAQAALIKAESYGLHTLLLTTSLQGEAREQGIDLGHLARLLVHEGKPIPIPACIIAGGETTVTLHGNGMGGRNQEMALSAVKGISGKENLWFITLATDGGDGPSNAAGAVVNGDTMARAYALGLDPDDFLNRNDSYHFFEPLGDLLIPGATLTNVNDLAFIFAF